MMCPSRCLGCWFFGRCRCSGSCHSKKRNSCPRGAVSPFVRQRCSFVSADRKRRVLVALSENEEGVLDKRCTPKGLSVVHEGTQNHGRQKDACVRPRAGRLLGLASPRDRRSLYKAAVAADGQNLRHRALGISTDICRADQTCLRSLQR